MSRPLIGIVCGPHFENGTLFYGLMPSYASSIAAAGGLPVLIVPVVDETTLRETYERMDAVLMAGGADV
ncbi:MAG: gamma-glutamyl-gamma-aminobutyrate hydrolase, partial [Candidatus Thermofonsia Clade 1 bacterium]